MKRRIAIVLTLVLMSLGVTSGVAQACPRDSISLGGGAPGLPSVCAMSIIGTGRWYVFMWP